MITDIRPSPLKNKRYRATIKMHDGISGSDGQAKLLKIDFGLKDGVTYIDGMRTTQERRNYLARHLANPIERKLIENLVPSSALLSAALLWGKHKSLEKNVEELNKLWKQSDIVLR
jgi:hypothetical protein